jgi:hypothetical protein
MNEQVKLSAISQAIAAERRLWEFPPAPIGEAIAQIPKVTKSSKPRKPSRNSVTKTSPK